MIGDGRSLLMYLPAPVLVGDPEGGAVYVNPSFAARFGTSGEGLTGAPLTSFFEGGAREAVLAAVARVCETGHEVRFRLREGGVPYTAVVAPIAAEGSNVGFVLLLNEAPVTEERLLAFLREIDGAHDAAASCLDALLEETGGRRASRSRDRVEEAMRALGRIRKWSEELRGQVSRREPSEQEVEGTFDPVELVQQVVAAASEDAAAAGVSLTASTPAELPGARGDGDRMALELVRGVRERIGHAPEGTALTLAVKSWGEDELACVLISLTATPPSGRAFAVEEEVPAAALRALVEAAGGSVAITADPVAGATTSIRIPVAR